MDTNTAQPSIQQPVVPPPTPPQPFDPSQNHEHRKPKVMVLLLCLIGTIVVIGGGLYLFTLSNPPREQKDAYQITQDAITKAKEEMQQKSPASNPEETQLQTLDKELSEIDTETTTIDAALLEMMPDISE